MATVNRETLEAVKDTVHLKANELISMDGIPDDLQQKIRSSMIGEKDRNKESGMDSLLSDDVQCTMHSVKQLI